MRRYNESLAGVLSAADACAMRSMHLDVSFNDLTGELPACLLDGTAATKSALLGGAVQVDSIKTRVESAPGFSA